MLFTMFLVEDRLETIEIELVIIMCRYRVFAGLLLSQTLRSLGMYRFAVTHSNRSKICECLHLWFLRYSVALIFCSVLYLPQSTLCGELSEGCSEL